MLIVAHPQSGLLLRPWTRTNRSDEHVSWSLPEAAPPLKLRAVRTWGDPAPKARFAIWIDEILVHDVLLNRIAGGHVADNHGYFNISGLSRKSIKVLAWRNYANPPGLHEALSTPISYPWNNVVVIEVIE